MPECRRCGKVTEYDVCGYCAIEEATIDLSKLDPSTATDSPELRELVAVKWMGWRPFENNRGRIVGWTDEGGKYLSALPGSASYWSPFTDPAHAGEARRLADRGGVDHHMQTCRAWIDSYDGFARFDETDGNIAQAEALATMRAILAAMKKRGE